MKVIEVGPSGHGIRGASGEKWELHEAEGVWKRLSQLSEDNESGGPIEKPWVESAACHLETEGQGRQAPKMAS